MFTTMNSGNALFALICVVFCSFSIIGCDADRNTQALNAKLARAEKRAQNAEVKLKQVEADLERAKAKLKQRISGNIAEFEELIEKIPQAIIEKVQTEQKKKSMDINVKFHIYNRKGIEGSVNVSFHLEEGPALEDKNRRKITISEKFTPKRVEDTLTVKLSMSYDQLNVKQPRSLKFILRIYDKPTDTFLDKESYSESFHFDPFKD